jgi:hypothetical protein
MSLPSQAASPRLPRVIPALPTDVQPLLFVTPAAPIVGPPETKLDILADRLTGAERVALLCGRGQQARD